MSFSPVWGSVLVREQGETHVSQLALMVCFQYAKVGCFELSISNSNRTISWTQRLNWFSFTGISHCFCFLSIITIQVIYSSWYRFRGGENGFFTNCCYAHHDAVINMTQWYQAAELIYFQDYSSLHGLQASESILLKGSISRTTVGEKSRFPDAAGALVYRAGLVTLPPSSSP